MADTFARQRQLIASTAEWELNDIVLALGEIGVEQVSSVDIRVKIGNGVDTWTMLPYISTFTSNINDDTLTALEALVAKGGDTMTGELILYDDPVAALGAVPKQYADAIRTELDADIDLRVIKTGDTMSGFLSHDLTPTAPQHTATKGYVDDVASGLVSTAGDTMSGPLFLSGAPTESLHAASKAYVDDGEYQSVVGGSAIYAGKVVKLNSSGMLDTSIVPVSSTYVGTVNLTLSYTLTGSYTVGSYFAVLTTGTIDASWNTKINAAPSTCTAGQMLIYNANGKWDLIGEAVSDAAIAGKVNRSGDTMLGALILHADPTTALGAATKQYADTKASVAYVDAGLATKQATGDYSLNGHTHIIANVTGLQTALDGKAATSHTHIIADVTGLQTALDGKQAAGSYSLTGHTHVIADVTGLQTALDGKQAAGSYAQTDVANIFTLNQTISRTGASAFLYIRGDNQQAKGIQFQTGSLARWQLNSDVGNETGSDSGSNLVLYRYSDAGANLGAVMSVSRATGVTTLAELLLSSPLAVEQGGTGATSATAARTNLGLVIGTNVQAYDADLSAIAALSATSGILKKTAANTWTLVDPVAVGEGGTGATTLTGIIKGNGTSAFTAATANTDYLVNAHINLGTLTTTSGTTQTLSGLTLTSYRRLLIIISGVGSNTATTNSLAVNGQAFTDFSIGSSGTIVGLLDVELITGLGCLMSGSGAQTKNTTITTADTSISFSWSGGAAFDAGTIRIYGVK